MKCESFSKTSLLPGNVDYNKPRMVFSSLNNIYMENAISPTYSIKYTLKGIEEYITSTDRYSIKEGQYIVFNKEMPFDFNIPYVDSTGICFHLTTDLITDVFRNLTCKEELVLDNPELPVANTDFYEIIYHHKENNLGKYLQHIAANLDVRKSEIDIEKDDLFYNLSHHLLLSQQLTGKKIEALQAKKRSTRKEVFKRIKLAQDIIHDNISTPIDIPQLSKLVALSEAHFYRCFKQINKCTPHQYHTAIRLKQAERMLRAKEASITKVADTYGFPDLATFSKLFKKVYKLTPRAYQEQAI